MTMQHLRRRFAVTAAALGAATLLAIGAPLSASAHVSLEENTATPGEFTTLTFRVPNETENASTNKLTITMPTAQGLFDSVSFVPVPGWTAQLVETKLDKPITTGDETITQAVTQVVWTADDPSAAYAPGSLGIFKLFVGAVPDVGKVSFPADQGYSDGSVVSWSDGVGGEHPAPVLYIDDKPATSDDPDSAPIATVTPTTATPAEPDVLARVLGGIGLLLGAVALVIAIVGRRPRGTAR